jgi:hypothetical protein
VSGGAAAGVNANTGQQSPVATGGAAVSGNTTMATSPTTKATPGIKTPEERDAQKAAKIERKKDKSVAKAERKADRRTARVEATKANNADAGASSTMANDAKAATAGSPTSGAATPK